MVKQFTKGGTVNLDCSSAENYCTAKVMIKVKDNWNAESCKTGSDCAANEDDKFVELEGEIEVKLR